MSHWLVICLRCDWSTVTDDMDDGAAKGSAHDDVCEGTPTVSPFEGTGVGAS